MEGYHRSVLLREVIDYLGVKKDKWYLDCTLGDGGHSLEILKLGGRVIGIDTDPEAIKRVIERFGREGIEQNRFKLIRGNFREMKNLTQQTELKDQKFAGAIFDLGVSSLQLESPERGFSFSKKGPLDMRMDPILQVKALDLVNALSRKELYELFKTLGEEKYSWGLAGALERARKVRTDSRFAVRDYSSRSSNLASRLWRDVKPGRISTTRELADFVERVVGRRKGEIHPATRVFLGLRIAVNDELNALREGLDQVKDLIEKNGVICVISFHSLEDRITKIAFREWEDKGLGEVLTKKPIEPSEEEIELNIRSRSAKMRVFET